MKRSYSHGINLARDACKKKPQINLRRTMRFEQRRHFSHTAGEDVVRSKRRPFVRFAKGVAVARQLVARSAGARRARSSNQRLAHAAAALSSATCARALNLLLP